MRNFYALILVSLVPLTIGCGEGTKEPVVLPAAEQQAAEDAYTKETEAAMAAEAAAQSGKAQPAPKVEAAPPAEEAEAPAAE